MKQVQCITGPWSSIAIAVILTVLSVCGLVAPLFSWTLIESGIDACKRLALGIVFLLIDKKTPSRMFWSFFFSTATFFFTEDKNWLNLNFALPCVTHFQFRLDDLSARNGGSEGKIHVIQVRTSPQRETAPNSFSASSEKRNSGSGFGKEVVLVSWTKKFGNPLGIWNLFSSTVK